MNSDHDVMDTTALLDELCEILPRARVVPLRISGNSMSPFLVHRRDTVYLSQFTRPLRRGDIVLYQRLGGAYILHRIYRLERDGYCFVGDGQTMLEHGVREEQLRAVVIAAERKGHRQQPGTFWWEFFEKVWIRVVPMRPMISRAYGWVKRLRKKKV